MNAEIIGQLMSLARASWEQAVVPFSGFKVGTAVEAVDGKMFGGFNIEAAPGESREFGSCGERVVINRAAPQQIRHLLVWTPTPWFVTPCGGCRDAIYLASDGAAQVTSVSEPAGAQPKIITRKIEVLMPRMAAAVNGSPHNVMEWVVANDNRNFELQAEADMGLKASSIPRVFTTVRPTGAALAIRITGKRWISFVRGAASIDATTRSGITALQSAINSAILMASGKPFTITMAYLLSGGEKLPRLNCIDLQRLHEFADPEGVKLYVVCNNEAGGGQLAEFLPEPFGPDDLRYGPRFR